METKEMEVGPCNVDTYKSLLPSDDSIVQKKEIRILLISVCNASKPIDVNVMRTDHTISGSLC